MWPRLQTYLLLLLVVTLSGGLIGCGDSGSRSVDALEISAPNVAPDAPAPLDNPPSPDIPVVDLPPGCNVFTPEPAFECFFPFPTDQFRRVGHGKARLEIPAEAFKPEPAAVPLDRVNALDGFSPASQIYYWDPGGFSLDGLPSEEESLLPDSPVQLIEWGTGRRLPVLVLPDMVADAPYEVLCIRPLDRLVSETRYVVALRDGLLDASGGVLAPPPLFDRFRAEEPVRASGGDDLSPHRARTMEVLAFLDAEGLPPEDLLVAWDFTTASDARLIDDHLGRVRDEVYARKAEISWDIIEDVHDPYPGQTSLPPEYRAIARRIRGVLSAPDIWGGDGLVKEVFTAIVPTCALEGDGHGKALIYGHGLFSTAAGEILSPGLRRIAGDTCTAMIGIDFQGIDSESREDLLEVLFYDEAHPLTAFQFMVDQALQGVASHLALGIVAADGAFWRSLGLGLVDSVEPVYLGISNGGIQGVAFLAFSREVSRGVLNVGGAMWTAMIEKHPLWGVFHIAMQFADELEAKKVLAVGQLIFDPIDPYTYAPYLTAGSKIFGFEPSQTLLQEALWDCRVPNFTFRALARAARIPAVQELIEPVFGLELVDATEGISGSAYTQWDTLADAEPPLGNVPYPSDQISSVTTWNGGQLTAHEALRQIPTAIQQMRHFLQDGVVFQLCSEQRCDPE